MQTTRPAISADIDRLVALERAASVGERSAQAYAKELELVWSRVLVLETHGAGVVAASVTWLVEDEAELHWVTVHPEQRRRGFAAELMRAAIADVRARGARRMVLEVRRSNEAAQALYRTCGFGPIGVRARYYQHDSEDAIVMELLIDAEP
ncbi:MAG: ribosomal protein S18-alanine N-acetyltransferase [Clostridia bacterium]|nr:ribosomal protein S18-alanine N-acetyltransferase [Deltaproteobacteria bacterium]